MHIVVFSQYHSNPDCPATSRHFSLLAHLAKTHRVTLITTHTWQQQRLTQAFPWVPEGVELRAATVPYHNRMGPLRRLWAFGRYALYAIYQGLRVNKPDVIWGISTPLTAAWAASQVARWRGVPWVFEVQDLWPSFPIAMGAVPSQWAQRQLWALEKRLYARARHVVALSPDMSRYVATAHGDARHVTTVLNGTDLALAQRATAAVVERLRGEQGLVGKQVVLYAGTFGRANAIPTLVAAVELLARQRPDMVWLFMGHGFYEPLIRAAAARCPAIRLVPPQPRHAVFAWFSLASLSVVAFLDLPVLDANSPAKLYDSLAVGTPVVVTNQGWTKQLVEEHACGWYAPIRTADRLATQLHNLLSDPLALQAAGERGRRLAEQQFDRNTLAVTMQRILEHSAITT